jgi:hypothetical protein
MTRRTRIAVFAVIASLVLSTAACTDLTGPRDADRSYDQVQGSGT